MAFADSYPMPQALTSDGIREIVAAFAAALTLLPGLFAGVLGVSRQALAARRSLIDGDNVVPIPRLIKIEDYLDYVSNRVMPDMDIRSALEGSRPLVAESRTAPRATAPAIG